MHEQRRRSTVIVHKIVDPAGMAKGLLSFSSVLIRDHFPNVLYHEIRWMEGNDAVLLLLLLLLLLSKGSTDKLMRLSLFASGPENEIIVLVTTSKSRGFQTATHFKTLKRTVTHP